jgi:hypothetical protein
MLMKRGREGGPTFEVNFELELQRNVIRACCSSSNSLPGAIAGVARALSLFEPYAAQLCPVVG